MARLIINNGETGLAVRNKLNANYAELYSTVLDNVVSVSVPSDFPTPIGGTIQLEDNKVYHITAPLSISDTITVGVNNTIIANSVFGNTLTYTGVGAMFNGVDKNILFHYVNLDAPSGSFFDFSTSVGTSTITMRGVTTNSCVTYGTFNVSGLDIETANCFSPSGNVITLTGTGWVLLSLDKFYCPNLAAGAKFLDLGTTVQNTLELSNLSLGGDPTAIGISGLASSGNMAVGAKASVSHCEFPSIIPLQNISVYDKRWDFKSNASLPDSTTEADIHMNALQVVDTGTGNAGVFFEIDGGNWSSDVIHRFTSSIAGVLTYIEESTSSFLVICTATVEKVGGGSDELALRIAKDGTSISGSQSVTRNTVPTSVTSVAIVTLSELSTLSAQVSNLTGNANVNVISAKISVIKSGG